jgi:hypothetical protein
MPVVDGAGGSRYRQRLGGLGRYAERCVMTLAISLGLQKGGDYVLGQRNKRIQILKKSMVGVGDDFSFFCWVVYL